MLYVSLSRDSAVLYVSLTRDTAVLYVSLTRDTAVLYVSLTRDTAVCIRTETLVYCTQSLYVSVPGLNPEEISHKL